MKQDFTLDGYASIAWNTGTWHQLETRGDLSGRQKKIEAIRCLVDEIVGGGGFIAAHKLAPNLIQGLKAAWNQLDIHNDDHSLAECEDLILQVLDFTVQRGRTDLPPIEIEVLPGSTIALTRKNLSAESRRDLDLVLSVVHTLNEIRNRLDDWPPDGGPVLNLMRLMREATRVKIHVPAGLFAAIDETVAVLGLVPSRALELELRLKTMDTKHRTQLWVPVLQTISYTVTEVDRLTKTLAETQRIRNTIKTVLSELLPWMDCEPKLEKNDCSRVHTFYEAVQEGRVFVMKDPDAADDFPMVDRATMGDFEALVSKRFGFASQELVDYIRTHQVFVVRHDWASALGPSITRAMDADGSLEANTLLPYNRTLFEFRVSGHTLLIQMEQADDGQIVRQGFMFRANSNDHWVGMFNRGVPEDDKLWAFAQTQITAICVALDIKVATHEVVRAPIALNEKRARKNKPPMEDYHVVDLSRRVSRAEPLSRTGQEPAYHMRAHLRRAHWRHYSTHRTRIPWMLVGDPELGFVHKFYLD